MIRAILCDLGGVLLHNNWQGVTARWEAELGLPPGEFLRAVYGGSDDTVLIGRVTEDNWWAEVCRRLGYGLELRERVSASFAEEERLDGELVRLLVSLRSSHRLAIVSNAWPAAAALARVRWRLDEVFDALIFSCEVGAAKPHEAIYRIACERLEVAPAEALFIDDGRGNVAAAAALGMHTILFDETPRVLDAVRGLVK